MLQPQIFVSYNLLILFQNSLGNLVSLSGCGQMAGAAPAQDRSISTECVTQVHEIERIERTKNFNIPVSKKVLGCFL